MSRTLLLLPLIALACDTTIAGKNDVLRFRYDADDTFLPAAFNTPVGAGLSVRVEVFVDPDGGGGTAQEPASIIDAGSSDGSVATVTATSGNVLTIRTTTAGTTEIRVDTSRGSDVFDLRVVDVTRVDLSHPGVLVSDNPPSKGIVGGTARFIVALKEASGAAAIGFGELQATVEPTAAMTVLVSEEVGYLPVRFEAAGAAAIAGLNDEPLNVEVVADADVTAIELSGWEAVESILTGGEVATVLRGLTAAGDKVVGVASLATVTVADPAVCSIAPFPKLGEGAYLVRGKASGTCRITATLGARESVREVRVDPK